MRAFLRALLALLVVLSLFLFVSCSGDDSDSTADDTPSDNGGDGGNGGTDDGKEECVHSYTTVTVDPTCDAEGYDEKTCTFCGEAVKENIVPAAHKYEDGVCTECGHEKCEHSYTTVTVEPTCDAEGYDEKTCTICGKAVKENIVPASHNYVNGVCTVCRDGDTGLEFTSNGDGTCYVSGLGECTDTDIVIPDISPDGMKVVGIGKYAFESMRMVTSITIGKGIVYISEYAFTGCLFPSSINVDPENEAYKTVDGSLYTKDGKVLVQYAIGREGSEFTVPSGVERIGTCAFAYSARLVKVTVGGDVTEIGTSAFGGCKKLEKVIIEEGVVKIGKFAFIECAKLTEVTVPVSVTVIEVYPFYSCTSLEKIYYGGSKSDWENIDRGDVEDSLVGLEIVYAKEDKPQGGSGYEGEWDSEL